MQETVGARIRRIAKAKELPAGKHLAAALGVSYEALRLWTAGTHAPTRKKAQEIADYLGVSVEAVMHGAPPAARESDAEMLADAFNALPMSTVEELQRRMWLYNSLMGSIAAQTSEPASAPAPAPAEQPTASPRQTSGKRP